MIDSGLVAESQHYQKLLMFMECDHMPFNHVITITSIMLGIIRPISLARALYADLVRSLVNMFITNC